MTRFARGPIFGPKNAVSNPASPQFSVGLTPDERKLYSQLFRELDPENTGIITGDKARSTFEKSGLPPPILGEIWQIADQNNLGFLTQFGFCCAMRLIGYTQLGKLPSAQLAESPGPLPRFANLQLPAPLQPQSTNSSFMQTQPSAYVPQDTQSVPQENLAEVSAADVQKFLQLFAKTVGSATGDLSGARARDIFMKSKLPTATLGQVWVLVDRQNLGKLDRASFVIAMHLIQGLLSGTVKQLPPFLPETVWQSVELAGNHTQPTQPGRDFATQSGSRQPSYASVSSQQTTVRHDNRAASGPPSGQSAPGSDWTVTPAMKAQYDSIFNNLDKSHKGQLSPDQVASFLMTSKLGQQDLATVWDLADVQNTGIFTPTEFAIALFLVNRKLAGGDLPNVVPHNLILSIEEVGKDTQSQSSQQQPSQTSQSTEPAALTQSVAPPQQLQQQKTAMDDLVDVFGSPTKESKTAEPALAPAPVYSASKSATGEFPRVRELQPFKPSSSFGQGLVKTRSPVLEEGTNRAPSKKEQHFEPPSLPQKVQPQLLGQHLGQPQMPAQFSGQLSSQNLGQQPAVNYDALRSVPPPPRASSQLAQAPLQPQLLSQSQQSQPHVSHQALALTQYQPPPFQAGNRDLLADSSSPVSGELSRATTDIANVSNQIKSLATQTSDLHEKKTRAEQELTRILTSKKEIEAKLKQLRSSYQNEVKQKEEVEANLASAKEETEALRSEASISEAKFNHISSELNEKQMAMEELQKQNSVLKERLGETNAEIVELQKQLERTTAENQRLTNQVSVKRSQLQVVLVKNDDLKREIEELSTSNRSILKELSTFDERERQAAAEQARLQSEHEKLQKEHAANSRSVSEKASSGLSMGAGAGVAGLAGIGAAIAGAAGLKSHSESKASEQEAEGIEKKEPETETNSTENAAPGASGGELATGSATESLKDTITSKDSVDSASIPVTAPSTTKEATSHTVATPFATSTATTGPVTLADLDASVEPSVGGPSSIVTNTYNDFTPVTSPSNSDFQFPEGASSGIATGVPGMPGDFPGVQRTDSLTSSVQNNAAMSVRDDNIDVSDREAASDRDTIPVSHEEKAQADVETIAPQLRNENDSSDADKVSSGVGSFEIVNAEDTETDQPFKDETKGHGAAHNRESFVFHPSLENDTTDVNNEFPPIRELDYDESSSDDEQPFDDAVSDQRKPETTSEDKPLERASKDDFDSSFAGLQPTTEEKPASSNDPFDEFDDLEAADEDNDNDNEFEGPPDFNEFTQSSHGAMFDNASTSGPADKSGTDEWEQLFAGFGNAQTAPPASSQVTHLIDNDHEAAIQELVGMGFDDETSRQALERELWNLEAATNYLLDHA